MDALDLGPEECTALRPDLIYASVTGFGSGGALAARPAYDTIGQSYGGLLSVLSNAGGAALTGAALADLVTGIAATTGILAGLVGRASSGRAQHVETSLMEAVSILTVDAMTQYFDDGQVPTRQSRHPQAQSFVVKTAAGEDLAIHLSSSQKFWTSFLDVIGRPELADDPRFETFVTRSEHYFELADIVETEFLGKTSAEWVERLTKYDVPYAPVLTLPEYLRHPQVEWLEMLEPEQDGLALLRPPWRFGGQRPHRDPHATVVGEHTREIALEVYDDATVDRLFADGVLYGG
jgi:crotonobetainyl-CoA:carnitine CoA-transferase CaiB-like acyl-CoA transferase